MNHIIAFVATITLSWSMVSGGSGEPVNPTCPFTGNPINPEITLEVGEATVGFCCGGCRGGFAKWDETKQLSYITSLSEEAAEIKEKEFSTPYLLDYCPISGSKLANIGDPVIEMIDGCEVRFCCSDCVGKFKEDKKLQFKKLDALMIAQQLPFYPVTNCFMTDEALDEHGTPIDFIYKNRLFRVCCNDCKNMFVKRPGRFIPDLDEAIIKAQTKNYPLTTCVIGGGSLDGMGGVDNLIVGNRLVKLCCAGCRSKVLKDPVDVFATIDAAAKVNCCQHPHHLECIVNTTSSVPGSCQHPHHLEFHFGAQ